MSEVSGFEFKILNGGGKILWTFIDEEGKRKHAVFKRELFDKFKALVDLAHVFMHPAVEPETPRGGAPPVGEEGFLGLSDDERLLR